MSLLLDSHVLLWWLADAPLSPAVRQRLSAPATRVVVSAAAIWELELKRFLGKLEAPPDLIGAVANAGFETLPIAAIHAVTAARLPPLHADPFDRMLIGQAQIEGLVLVTRDEMIGRYGIPILPA